MQNFSSFLMALIILNNFQKCSLGITLGIKDRHVILTSTRARGWKMLVLNV